MNNGGPVAQARGQLTDFAIVGGSQSTAAVGAGPRATRARSGIELSVVVIATGFVLWRLRPALLVTDTLPARRIATALTGWRRRFTDSPCFAQTQETVRLLLFDVDAACLRISPAGSS